MGWWVCEHRRIVVVVEEGICARLPVRRVGRSGGRVRVWGFDGVLDVAPLFLPGGRLKAILSHTKPTRGHGRAARRRRWTGKNQNSGSILREEIGTQGKGPASAGSPFSRCLLFFYVCDVNKQKRVTEPACIGSAKPKRKKSSHNLFSCIAFGSLGFFCFCLGLRFGG